jgi:hypothetical protein
MIAKPNPGCFLIMWLKSVKGTGNTQQYLLLARLAQTFTLLAACASFFAFRFPQFSFRKTPPACEKKKGNRQTTLLTLRIKYKSVFFL